jgi:acetyl-CoA acyltransferase
MDAFIVDYARTPFHFAKKGRLAPLRPDDLAAQLVRALVARQAFSAEEIEDVLLGCAYPEGAQGDNLARIVSFLAGLPNTAGGMTMNRFCGSSMSAVHVAAGSLATGAGDAFLCVGVESMSSVPQGGLSPSRNPRLQADYPEAYTPMGITAENLARRHGITREQQDAFAVGSQRKAAAAFERGAFAGEVVSVKLPDGSVVDGDGCLRPATTMEGLAGLKAAFLPESEGTVTAGTSSPLTDGASAVLVANEAFVRRHDLKPLARIRSVAVAGVPPEIMGIGPVPATKKVLDKTGLSLADIDLIEINEAFAAQVIACERELKFDRERLNLLGGGISLGHPIGMSGARILLSLAYQMRARGAALGLATLCISGGQGLAVVLERTSQR